MGKATQKRNAIALFKPIIHMPAISLYGPLEVLQEFFRPFSTPTFAVLKTNCLCDGRMIHPIVTFMGIAFLILIYVYIK